MVPAAYDKFVEGQRFADQIPGTRTYSGYTLESRHQPDKLSALQKNTIHDQNRFLTSKMREQGLEAPPIMCLKMKRITTCVQDNYLRLLLLMLHVLTLKEYVILKDKMMTALWMHKVM